ncbi:MAG: hypothetical protein AB1Z29_21790, partial [Desulfobacterales bacterium]
MNRSTGCYRQRSSKFILIFKVKENIMIVGVLKEIKAEENRVCMTPAGVEIIGQNGHTVLVEKNAGKG